MTEREKEILEYVCLGLSNQEISERMNLSSHTIKKDIAQFLAKYQARNRVELASKSIKFGLIDRHKLFSSYSS